MNDKIAVSESAQLESPNEDGTFKVRILVEGKGSSGIYTKDLIEEYGDVYNGVPSYFSHAAGERNPLDLAGKIEGETWVEELEDGRTALFGNYRPRKSEAIGDLFENFRDTIALSIFATGEGTESEDGDIIVESFDRDNPRTRVDIVDAAGAGGAFMESFKPVEKSATESTSVGAEDEEKGTALTDEQITALAEAIAAKVGDTLSETLKEALAPAEGVAEATEVAEAIVAADLPAESRVAVYESVKAGTSVDDAIAKQKALVEAVEASVKARLEEAGASFGTPAGTPATYRGYGK